MLSFLCLVRFYFIAFPAVPCLTVLCPSCPFRSLAYLPLRSFVPFFSLPSLPLFGGERRGHDITSHPRGGGGARGVIDTRARGVNKKVSSVSTDRKLLDMRRDGTSAAKRYGAPYKIEALTPASEDRCCKVEALISAPRVSTSRPRTQGFQTHVPQNIT